METKLYKFIQACNSFGLSDYEIYLCLFSKHFKFLKSYGKLEGYFLSHYSWVSRERLIKYSSKEFKKSICFFLEGNDFEVYFTEEKILTQKVLRLEEFQNIDIKNYKLPADFTLEDLEKLLEKYANLIRLRCSSYLNSK